MATVTITLAGSSVVNGNKSWTISDTDVQTLIDTIKDRESTPDPGGVVKPVPTNAQALAIWAQSFIDATTQQDENYRRNKAQNALTVPPIVFA